MNKDKKYLLMDPMTYEKHMSEYAQTSPILKRESDMNREMRQVLDSDDPDDIKVLKYSQILAKLRGIHKLPEENNIDEKYILDSIAENVRHKAKRLLDKVIENTKLGWNNYGELIYRQTPIPNSNIVQLLTDIMKTRTHEKPVGWQDFAEALAGNLDRVDKELVPNPSSWKIISGEKKARVHRARSRTRRISDSAPTSTKNKENRALSRGRGSDVNQSQLTLDMWDEY